MDKRSIVLLTDPTFFEALRTLLKEAGPTQHIIHAATVDELRRLSDPNMRLIAFCTDVIVPVDVLRKFNCGTYNFHPGPPDLPGIFPSCFAIYKQTDRFGVTAHRMTEIIDSGDIVGTEYFEIEPGIDRLTLDTLTYNAIIQLFGRLAPELTNFESQLRNSGEQWSGSATTRKDFEKLCEISMDISESDFQLRYRAVGEGPNHALYLNIHGHRFRLDNPRDEKIVYRGGQTADKDFTSQI